MCSLAGYPPFSPDRGDKPMQQQILTGDYQHYMREKFWDKISDDGGYYISSGFQRFVDVISCTDIYQNLAGSQLRVARHRMKNY